MDSIYGRTVRGSQDFADGKIRLGCWRRADMYGLVDQLDVACARICVRINGHGTDTEAAASMDDATSDFTAIGDQEAFYHFRTSTPQPIIGRNGPIGR
jgi:hypothetical protein